MAIEFSDAEKKEILPSIQKYMREEFETELSDMRAGFLLKFILEEVGPMIYNKAIKDAEQYMTERVVDLSAACYEPPGGYWQKKKKKETRR